MRFNKTARLLIFFLAVLLILKGALYVALPIIAEKLLLPMISGALKGAAVSLRVRTLTGNRFDLAKICLGETNNPLLSIDAINTDYRLTGLFKKQIDKISVSGLHLRAVVTDDGVDIPLFGFVQGADSAVSRPLSVTIRSLEVLNASVLVVWGKKTFNIPFSLKASQVFPERTRYLGVLKIKPFNQEITVTAEYDIVAGEGTIMIKVPELDLGVLSKPFESVTGQEVSGFMSLNLAADVTPSGVNLSELHIEQLLLSYNGIELCLEPHAADTPGIFIKKLQQGLTLTIQGLSIKKPVPLLINTDAEAISLATKNGGVQLTGTLLFTFDGESFNRDFAKQVRLLKFPEDALKISVEIEKGGGWNVSFTRAPAAKEYAINTNDLTCSISPRVAFVNITGSTAETATEFVLEISPVSCAGAGFSFNFPSITCAGSLKLGEEGNFMINSVTKFSVAEMKVGDFYARKLHGEIPFSLPAAQQQKLAKGFIAVNNISYADYNLGSLYADVFPRDFGFILKGRAKPVPDTVFDVSGKAQLNFENGFAFNGDITIADVKKNFAAKLDSINRQFEGVSASGQLGAKIQLGIERGAFTGRAWIAAKGVDISSTTAGFEIKDVALEAEMDDLTAFRSRPAQQAVFAGVSLGDIKTGRGEALFHVESVDSLFFEKARLDWAGGHVYAYAVRISPAQEDMEFILFCDRLKLKEILNELDIAEADGEGTLNGRIPLRITKGQISIDDGFLYSAPGQGGRLKIKNTNTLAPLNQSLELSIAKDALKDFNYEWAKMTMNTSDDTLIIPLQIYGKPAGTMPYTYDKKRGLRKAEEGKLQAAFEGIQFDINFKLPLNRLLRYKERVDKVMKR